MGVGWNQESLTHDFVIIPPIEHLLLAIVSQVSTMCCRRRQWHPTPVLLPGKSHEQRSLVDCSPWGCTESDTTEQLSTAQHSRIGSKYTKCLLNLWDLLKVRELLIKM